MAFNFSRYRSAMILSRLLDNVCTLGGSAAVNVEHYEEREEARVSYVVDLSNTGFEFPMPN